MGFTKLDGNLLQSSIMAEPSETFKVFITILASTGPDGIARVSSTFLAAACYLPIGIIDEALLSLEAPDPRSRSLNDDGRRIKRVDGGYFVVNYEKYRSFTYSDKSEAARKREYRKKLREGDIMGHHGTSPGHSASASSSEELRIGVPASSPQGTPEGFDEFWSRYPRKRSKQDAIAAYKAARKTASAELILAALDAYKGELDRKGTAEEYIKHAATFLRKDRWRDYVPEPKMTAEEFKRQQDEELRRLRGKS